MGDNAQSVPKRASSEQYSQAISRKCNVEHVLRISVTRNAAAAFVLRRFDIERSYKPLQFWEHRWENLAAVSKLVRLDRSIRFRRSGTCGIPRSAIARDVKF